MLLTKGELELFLRMFDYTFKVPFLKKKIKKLFRLRNPSLAFSLKAHIKDRVLRHHVQKEFFFRRNMYRKKHFLSKEENNCEEEILLAPEDRIANIDCCKCGCECKPMATFAESSC